MTCPTCGRKLLETRDIAMYITTASLLANVQQWGYVCPDCQTFTPLPGRPAPRGAPQP